MKIITLKLNDQSEWRFLLDLLRRLNINFEWKEEQKMPEKNGRPSDDIISELFGSWPSNQSSDEFVKTLLDARVSQTREINL